MEEPQLVLGTTRRHIEALTGRLPGERADSFIWCSHHAEKHDVPLIALERIGVTADQPSFLNDFWF